MKLHTHGLAEPGRLDGTWARLGVVATARSPAGPRKRARQNDRDARPRAKRGLRHMHAVWGGPHGRPRPGYIYMAVQANWSNAEEPARTRLGAVATARCLADGEERERRHAPQPEASQPRAQVVCGVAARSIYTGCTRGRAIACTARGCIPGAGAGPAARRTLHAQERLVRFPPGATLLVPRRPPNLGPWQVRGRGHKASY